MDCARTFACGAALAAATACLSGVYTDPTDPDRRAEWSNVDSPTERRLNAIHGGGEDDVWAVGDRGVILHWSGDAWRTVASPTSYDLNDVWAADATHAWAVGDGGCLLTWDGARWSLRSGLVLDYFGEEVDLVTISGVSANDLWLAPGEVVLIPGDSTSSDALLHSSDGGLNWSPYRMDLDGWPVDLVAVSNRDVWLASGYEVQRWQNGSWGRVDIGLSSPPSARAIWGASEQGPWLIGSGLGAMILEWAGSRWIDHGALTGEAVDPLAVWGRDGRVWVAGLSGAIVRFDATGWASEREPSDEHEDILGIWGSRSGEVWAVGRGGEILRR